jgi:uncharacterized NAD(P)/FAD-binding protein YdhS
VRPPNVSIVGGGFTGASVAIQLLRATRAPLAVRILDPREQLGGGLAFASTHRDHRLNGPASSHSVLPDDLQHLVRWCEQAGLRSRDPEAVCGNALFLRRADFARYVRETLGQALADAPAGCTLEHVRDEAVRVLRDGAGYAIETRGSGMLPCDLAVLAAGNPPRSVPRALQPLLGLPGLVADPYDLAALAQLPRGARVLVLGTGLTAMDVVCTLVRQGHTGPVALVSRRALLPRPHPRLYVPPGAPGAAPAAPAYAREGEPSVRRWLAGLRQVIGDAVREGREWHGPFDELRDAVWQLWPQLPPAEKARFNRHLRTWYDTHRFRIPGPTEAIVRDALERGQLTIAKGRVVSAQAQGGAVRVLLASGQEQVVDALVNATGFEADAMPALLHQGIADGLLAAAPVGPGVDVDSLCRALDANGVTQDRLRVFGPPTAGRHADPLGTAFIRAHIARAVPGMLELLTDGADPTAAN